MKVYAAYFFSLLFVALSLVPAGAHLLSLPNKIDMRPDAYLHAQEAYRGWSFTGFFVVGAVISTVSLVALLRRCRSELRHALVACGCMVTTQIMFWLFTFPANRVTDNWTTLPVQWESLRMRWEYSHAVSAVLNFIALVTLIVAALNYHKDELSNVALRTWPAVEPGVPRNPQ